MTNHLTHLKRLRRVIESVQRDQFMSAEALLDVAESPATLRALSAAIEDMERKPQPESVEL